MPNSEPAKESAFPRVQKAFMYEKNEQHHPDEQKFHEIEIEHIGLTKREYAAITNMAALVSAMSELKRDVTQEQMAKEAVELADALLAELGEKHV